MGALRRNAGRPIGRPLRTVPGAVQRSKRQLNPSDFSHFHGCPMFSFDHEMLKNSLLIRRAFAAVILVEATGRADLITKEVWISRNHLDQT